MTDWNINDKNFSSEQKKILLILEQFKNEHEESDWVIGNDYLEIEKEIRKSLSKISNDAIPLAISILKPLVKAKEGRDRESIWSANRSAAILMGLIGDHTVVSTLIEYTSYFDNEDESDMEIAEEMGMALWRVGGDAVGELIEALDNAVKVDARGNTEITIRSIVDALGSIADERAIEPLIKTLNSDAGGGDWITAKNCVWSLSVFADVRAANAIVDALQHGDGDVERVARDVLRYGLVEGSFNKDPIRGEAIKSMISLLQSEDESAVINAAWVLGDICEESAIKPLQNLISGDKKALDTSVEYFVTKALDRIHSGEVNIEGEG